MTPCPDPQTLCLYIAEALDDPRRREVDSHVDGCPSCQEALRAMLPPVCLPGVETATVCDRRPAGGDSDGQPPAIPGYVLSGQKLGSGGMAAVWLGRDTHLNRDVAVKVMRHVLRGRPHLARRFVEGAPAPGGRATHARQPH